MSGKTEYKILILDDKESVIKSFERELDKLENIHVSLFIGVQTETDTFKELEQQKFDLLFVDQRLKDGKLGSEVAKRIKEKYEDAYIIMQTAFGLDSAEEAIRSRVFSDFISKSNDEGFNRDLLLQIFTRYDVYREHQEKIKELESVIKTQKSQLSLFQEMKINLEDFKDSDSLFKGDSDLANEIRFFITQYAKNNLPVLLLGETGTGKDVIAQEIHKLSEKKGEFVSVNCSALPKDLIESELFGHKKGAFTGALSDKKGYFTQAKGGTLFLDEFGDLSPDAQVKILRAIENKEYYPLGSEIKEKTDARIICATSQKLQEFTGKNSFRIDLFFRVGGLFPEISPLRDRPEDIWAIFDSKTLKDYCDCLDFDAKKAIVEFKYNWPGNVRELKNFIVHSVAIFYNNIHKKRITGIQIEKCLELWKSRQPLKREDWDKMRDNNNTEYMDNRSYKEKYSDEDILRVKKRLDLFAETLSLLGNKNVKIEILLAKAVEINKSKPQEKRIDLGKKSAGLSGYFGKKSDKNKEIALGLFNDYHETYKFLPCTAPFSKFLK